MIYTLLKAVLAVLGAYLIGLHLLGIYVSVLWIAEKIDLQKMSRFAKPFGIAVCALLAIVVCGSCGMSSAPSKT